MIKELFFRLIVHLKYNTTCKFILAGDWGQLPPVCDRSAFDYENSSAIHYICDGQLMQLSSCRRADKELFEAYTNVHKVNTTNYGTTECERSLAFHNSVRKAVNTKWMDKLKTQDAVIVLGNKRDKNSQNMYVYPGLPIISVKTCGKYDLVNGEEFYVKEFSQTTITINSTYQDLVIDIDDFGSLFYPAYCLTIHKSQGCTFDKPYSIYEWDVLDEKLKYVAMSRATKKENINFCELII